MYVHDKAKSKQQTSPPLDNAAGSGAGPGGGGTATAATTIETTAAPATTEPGKVVL